MRDTSINMRNSNHSPKTRQIGVLLFPEFSNYGLANAVEPLRAANTLARQKLYEWQFLGINEGTITSSSGLPVTPSGTLTDHPGGDLLLVMPSYDYKGLTTPTVLRALRSAQKRFAQMAGLDTGSWLMAAAGLLEGQRATIHWDELVAFSEQFPEINVVEDRYISQGPMLSCGGASTSIELMLDLIGQHHGTMLRLEVAALFMHGERKPSDVTPLRMGDDQVVQAAVSIMRRTLETPLPIDAIAKRLGFGLRALEKHFASSAGRSPRSVYVSLRLGAARHLTEQTTLSVSEIATRCGYEDPSAMTRAFRREFGITPRDIRKNLT
ncbi:AraC family transcriptional regulator with amidase-like domain [Pelagimonas varians]|uniref:HTH-type transcriptional regulator CdhR n=2 Tax=Pelagimonas varians TaxID=696760 RepID=A0A238KUP3_9RHOB|nr:AraC family transcriptional regulator with amidase-like domain [Pelagimonas varians]SMX46398.1 HTH-type transcriptional regulator CdhR [Pelagimonas varians]